MNVAEELISECRERGLTVGTAESLTAGLISATLAEVPGCSAVLRGGIVAYHPDVKAAELSVPEALLDHVVSAPVACAMVLGALERLGVDLAIATTGVAGPDWLDDQPPGRVWVAAGLRAEPPHARCIDAPGDRAAVRQAATREALKLAIAVVRREYSPVTGR